MSSVVFYFVKIILSFILLYLYLFHFHASLCINMEIRYVYMCVFFLKMNVMILLSKKINQFSSVLNPDVIEVLVVKADEFSLN